MRHLLLLIVLLSSAAYPSYAALPKCTSSRPSSGRHRTLTVTSQVANSRPVGDPLWDQCCCTFTHVVESPTASISWLATYDGSVQEYPGTNWDDVVGAALGSICGMAMGSQDCANCPASPGGATQGASGMTGSASGTAHDCYTQLLDNCQLQMAAAMISNGASLMQCAMAQRAALAPVCQVIVDRLNRDSLGLNLIACMKKAYLLCPTEISPLQGAPLDTDRWASVLKCYDSKSAELDAGCQTLIQENLAAASAAPSHTQEPWDDHCDEGEPGCDKPSKDAAEGANTGWIVATVVSLLLMLGAVGAAFYFRQKLLEAGNQDEAETGETTTHLPGLVPSVET